MASAPSPHGSAGRGVDVNSDPERRHPGKDAQQIVAAHWLARSVVYEAAGEHPRGERALGRRREEEDVRRREAERAPVALRRRRWRHPAYSARRRPFAT